MKDKLSIGQFAKLKNVTTETLRHYDRIGLLKPIKVDPKTGYRYYSIFQEEQLGTIKELRQLGMSIEDIKKYFNNRNLMQSASILKEKHNELKNRIKELQKLEESIREKIIHLEEVSQVSDFGNIVFKDIKEREIITFDKSIKSDIDLSYAFIELESLLEGIAPILASNRMGTIIKQEDVTFNKYAESAVLFFSVKDKENIDKTLIKIIPKGMYACMYCKGRIWDMDINFKKIIKYINKNGYEICGDIIQIVQIDISVTGQCDEEVFEIQVPVKKY